MLTLLVGQGTGAVLADEGDAEGTEPPLMRDFSDRSDSGHRIALGDIKFVRRGRAAVGSQPEVECSQSAISHGLRWASSYCP